MLEEVFQLTPEVVEAINEELRYTASLHSIGRADTKDHGVAGQILTLEEYAPKVRSAWVGGAGDEGEQNALDIMRKIAGIACGALLKYGCPRRKMPQ